MKTFEEFPMTPTNYKASVVSGRGSTPQIRAAGRSLQGGRWWELLRQRTETSSEKDFISPLKSSCVSARLAWVLLPCQCLSCVLPRPPHSHSPSPLSQQPQWKDGASFWVVPIGSPFGDHQAMWPEGWGRCYWRKRLGYRIRESHLCPQEQSRAVQLSHSLGLKPLCPFCKRAG